MFIITDFDLTSDYAKIYKFVNLSGDIITRITFSNKYKLPKDGTYLINSYGRVCQKIRKKLESVGYIDRNTGFDYMFKDNEIYITKIDLGILAQHFDGCTAKHINMIDLSKYKNYDMTDIESQQALLYLPNLERLNIGADILSGKIWQLTKLRKLVLWADFEILPSDIGNLINLIKLSISSRSITELPITIGLLTKLIKLECVRNYQLKYIPTELGLLTNLTELIFNSCDIVRIPTEICKLTKLYYLKLEYNKLNKLPIEIGKLTNLITLMLSYNEFTYLPTEIGHLTNIIILDIDNNNISTLPSEIGLLKKMTKFSCYNNRLTGTIPDEIKQLSKCMILTGYK